MNTYPITCGSCSLGVAANIVSTAPDGSGTAWLQCPNCREGSVRTRYGQVFPIAPAGRLIAGLPIDVETAWREARISHAVGAYTASEIMCRKILMHVAVDVAASPHGRSFLEYVEDLSSAGYIMKGLKDTVDLIRKRGNVANHELIATSEKESLVTLVITEHLLEGIYELANITAP
jgi:hypothetical protein